MASMPRGFFSLLIFPFFPAVLFAQTPQQVLVVVNRQSSVSRPVGEYYMKKRKIPAANRCTIDVAPDESVSREDYEKRIEAPIAGCLKSRGLTDRILYIVLTKGVPLKMWPVAGSSEINSDGSSID